VTPNEFQDWTRKTSVYPGVGTGNVEAISYATLGLVGESGEVAEAVKKFLRGDYGRDVLCDKIKLELGDVQFYLARLCTEFGLTLEEVMRANQLKLERRKANSTIKGSGSER